MTNKQKAFAAAADTIIKNLEKRNMEGYFFADSASCVKTILSMMPKGSSIAWGGSETLTECGMMEALSPGDYQLIDRMQAKDPEEARALYARIVLSDFYFMSTNAITLDGQLVNIDGAGNRVACLIHGPGNVMVIAGMNKLASDVESAVKRVRDIASPANAVRLDKNTPCHATGRCADCLSPDCICSQTVITRRSRDKGRIKVFLIAEELGY